MPWVVLLLNSYREGHYVRRISHTRPVMILRRLVAAPAQTGTPTPRSWVARMTKRSAPTGAGQERLATGQQPRSNYA
jgi:hypothetical protein